MTAVLKNYPYLSIASQTISLLPSERSKLVIHYFNADASIIFERGITERWQEKPNAEKSRCSYEAPQAADQGSLLLCIRSVRSVRDVDFILSESPWHERVRYQGLLHRPFSPLLIDARHRLRRIFGKKTAPPSTPPRHSVVRRLTDTNLSGICKCFSLW